jgi:hypothetical protein
MLVMQQAIAGPMYQELQLVDWRSWRRNHVQYV